MKIERIELYHISQPLVSPFQTSFGTLHHRECLLLSMHSEGLTGWGECVALNDPGYTYETPRTAWHILCNYLIPDLVGRDLEEPDDLLDWMYPVRGHLMAKAAADQAAWDLTAQRDGLSFAQKLAAPYTAAPHERVAVGVSVGIQPTIDQTLDKIRHYQAAGYRRVKLKIKPGHDLTLARKVRETFPDLPLMLDANSAYQLSDAPLFQAMDDLNLLMIEQPLGHDDIYEHSRLRPLIQSPLCLDESIHTLDNARVALALGACDIINIKPGRVGGWTMARRIHDLCLEADIPVWCGGMLETGVGRAGQLALAGLPGFTLPGDISATARYYHKDVTSPFPINSEDSTITVPTKPGLGIEVDARQLRAVTLRRVVFKAGQGLVFLPV